MVDWWGWDQESKKAVDRLRLVVNKWMDYKEEKDMEEFTLDDLKDGMVVEHRDGDEYYVIGGQHYSDKSRQMGGSLEDNYCDRLLYVPGNNKLDIMKVSYMGEVLWEREEWVEVTPLEALRALAKKGEPLKARMRDCQDFSGYSVEMLSGCLLHRESYPFFADDEFWNYCKMKKSDLS